MKALEFADKVKISVPHEVRKYITKYLPLWQDIWNGDVPWKYTYSHELDRQRKRELLGAAQSLCSYISKISMAEFSVHIDNAEAGGYIGEILTHTNFRERIREADERKEALGSVVIKLYIQDNKIEYSFISGKNFIPLAWNSHEITDALFVSEFVNGKKYYTQIERQRLTSKKQVTIEQYLCESSDSHSLGYPLLDYKLKKFGLRKSVTLNTDKLLFVYIKPALSNKHVPMGCPLGTSRFDGAEEVLKAVDIAFDELQIERLMSEKMIFVSPFMVDRSMDVEGVPRVAINKDTRIYQFLSMESNDDQMPKTFDPNFRIEEHRLDLQTQLDLLCFKTGIDTGSISFDGQHGIKTAEEIRAENSKTFQTVVDNQKIWKEQLERLFAITIEISQLFGLFPDFLKIPQREITVDFDDSVTPDRKTYIDEGLRLFNSGAISQKTFLTEYLNYSDERADEEISRCR